MEKQQFSIVDIFLIAAVLTIALTFAVVSIYFLVDTLSELDWRTIFERKMGESTLAVAVIVFGILGIFQVSYRLRKGNRFLAILTVLFAMASVILFYTLLYDLVGIYDNRHGIKKSIQHSNIKQCLYFSAVTWTTLGYGDLHPDEGLSQFLAASEAIMGYVYMGLLVASIYCRKTDL